MEGSTNQRYVLPSLMDPRRSTPYALRVPERREHRAGSRTPSVASASVSSQHLFSPSTTNDASTFRDTESVASRSSRPTSYRGSEPRSTRSHGKSPQAELDAAAEDTVALLLKEMRVWVEPPEIEKQAEESLLQYITSDGTPDEAHEHIRWLLGRISSEGPAAKQFSAALADFLKVARTSYSEGTLVVTDRGPGCAETGRQGYSESCSRRGASNSPPGSGALRAGKGVARHSPSPVEPYEGSEVEYVGSDYSYDALGASDSIPEAEGPGSPAEDDQEPQLPGSPREENPDDCREGGESERAYSDELSIEEYDEEGSVEGSNPSGSINPSEVGHEPEHGPFGIQGDDDKAIEEVAEEEAASQMSYKSERESLEVPPETCDAAPPAASASGDEASSAVDCQDQRGSPELPRAPMYTDGLSQSPTPTVRTTSPLPASPPKAEVPRHDSGISLPGDRGIGSTAAPSETAEIHSRPKSQASASVSMRRIPSPTDHVAPDPLEDEAQAPPADFPMSESESPPVPGSERSTGSDVSSPPTLDEARGCAGSPAHRQEDEDLGDTFSSRSHSPTPVPSPPRILTPPRARTPTPPPLRYPPQEHDQLTDAAFLPETQSFPRAPSRGFNSPIANSFDSEPESIRTIAAQPSAVNDHLTAADFPPDPREFRRAPSRASHSPTAESVESRGGSFPASEGDSSAPNANASPLGAPASVTSELSSHGTQTSPSRRPQYTERGTSVPRTLLRAEGTIRDRTPERSTRRPRDAEQPEASHQDRRPVRSDRPEGSTSVASPVVNQSAQRERHTTRADVGRSRTSRRTTRRRHPPPQEPIAAENETLPEELLSPRSTQAWPAASHDHHRDRRHRHRESHDDTHRPAVDETSHRRHRRHRSDVEPPRDPTRRSNDPRGGGTGSRDAGTSRSAPTSQGTGTSGSSARRRDEAGPDAMPTPHRRTRHSAVAEREGEESHRPERHSGRQHRSRGSGEERPLGERLMLGFMEYAVNRRPRRVHDRRQRSPGMD